MSGRLLVLGDIHGAARALDQVLERAKFDSSTDRLICLGDVCDGWPETKQAFDMLLQVKDLILLIGNHDEWLLEWVRYTSCPPEWWHQGGKATIWSYGHQVHNLVVAATLPFPRIPPEHERLLTEAKSYHVQDDMAFVHGGFRHDQPVDQPPPGGWTWDRSLWDYAQVHPKDSSVVPYHLAFIGHTSTERQSLEPVKAANVWNLDQGAGWHGKLSLMDAHTEQYWQSDLVVDLYPEVKGRE